MATASAIPPPDESPTILTSPAPASAIREVAMSATRGTIAPAVPEGARGMIGTVTVTPVSATSFPISHQCTGSISNT